ncbi:MAG TPA: hypothetical protein DCS93_39140 [Microscillaceae bacterium]|nr:hypothetical protein [Microscillaceae bacterium]
MKNYVAFIIALILGLNISAQAQKIGQIKKKAKSNSNRRSSERRSSGSGGSSGSGSDFNGEGCLFIFNACIDLLDIFSSIPSSESQTSTYTPSYSPPPPPANDYPDPAPIPEEKPPVADSTPVLPPPNPVTVTPLPVVVKPKAEPRNYFQLKASYGFLPNNYEVFRPGARVRFGKKHGFGMAFDYRYNYLTEKVLSERTSYFTHDLQLLQFAPETNSNVEIRAGFGFMIDEFAEWYPEFLVGFNALAGQMRWNFGTEVRIANDFSNDIAARLEWGSHLQYALVNQPKFKLYGGLRTKVASYFGNINVWSIGLGLTMRIY